MIYQQDHASLYPQKTASFCKFNNDRLLAHVLLGNGHVPRVFILSTRPGDSSGWYF
jgi:acetoin utilization deacetylase AcuC-like enzyme